MHSGAIGIDVGGTGIKGAAVDVRTGEALTRRHRVATPAGGSVADISREVAAMVAGIRQELSDLGHERVPDRVGVTLPGVVRDGIMLTAANVAREWIGIDAAALFSDATGIPCTVVNDADAAGLAEARLGAAAGAPGMTMVLTFGTGIGSACLFNGMLVPNFELGHLHLDGHRDAERWASPKAIAREGIDFAEWADRAARYVQHLELVLHPDRFVIGGSISKDSARFLPFPGVRATTVPARFHNNAGIIGCALRATEAADAIGASGAVHTEADC